MGGAYLPVGKGGQASGLKEVELGVGGLLESFQEGRTRVEGGGETSEPIEEVAQALDGEGGGWGGGWVGGRGSTDRLGGQVGGGLSLLPGC